MNPKKISFKAIEQVKYLVYWKKAQDFYQSMFRAYSDKIWHSVGLEAVHCALSSTDALLVYSKGIRCTGQNHHDLIDLLVDQLNGEETKKYSDTLLKIISMKNIVEYEDRLFTEQEAAQILKRTERYFGWIKNKLHAIE